MYEPEPLLEVAMSAAKPRESSDELVRVKREIARQGSHDLNVLSRRGCDTEAFCSLLGWLACNDEIRSEKWKERMRLRCKELKKLSRKIRRVIRAAEKLATAEKEASGVSVFDARRIFPGLTLTLQGSGDPNLAASVLTMQSLAEVYENEAKRTAQFLRSGRTDLPLLFLIWYVRGTSKSGDNWGELARLLTDAFEAAGKSGDFSPEKLRMLWKRQGDVVQQMYFRALFEPASL